MLALNQEAKEKILIEEWKQAKEQQEVLPDKSEVSNQPAEAKVESPAPALPAAFQKKLTLRASGVSLKTLLSKIAQVTGSNVIYGPEVDLSASVFADCLDVPVWRALNTALFPLNYGFKIKDRDLVILSSQTRAFKLSLPPNTQSFSDRISNESWTKTDGQDTSSASSNSSMDVKVGAGIFVESRDAGVSFWDDIEKSLSEMISPQGKYSFNKLAGLVTVTDSPVVLDKVASYIDLVNREANKQILVEVKILEVTLSNESSFGIDWSAIYKSLGNIKQLSLSSDFVTQNFVSPGVFSLFAAGPKDDSGSGSSGLSALVKVLEAQGKVRVLSQPKVMLLNNQSAMVQVGTVTSFVANTTTTTSQAGLASTSAATDQVQEGVSLRLMASILDGQILVQLTPVVTTLEQIRSIKMGSGTTIEAPQTSTKSMHTLVKIKDGSTIAVGGLITSNHKKSEKGIPILKDLPLVGRLFAYKNNSRSRTELVIFITPKILQR